MGTEFCMLEPDIFGFSACNFFHVTLLAPRLMRLVLDVSKIYTPLQKSLTILPPKLLLTMSTLPRTLPHLPPLSLIHITFQAFLDFALPVCAVT